MIVGIHNVKPDNDNREARFAEMCRQVDTMKKTMDQLSKPGAIEQIVNDAVRPIAAEMALREKEMKERQGMLLNGKRPTNRFLLPKVD